MATDFNAVVREIGRKARAASRVMAHAGPEAKNNALLRVAGLLREWEKEILAANAEDCAQAEKRGIDAPRLQRLRLTPEIIAEMAEAAVSIAHMADPVGAMDEQWQRPNGLLAGRMRVPLGVIAMVYEARPNVTVDAAILALKAGNAIILRGGSEAARSNAILAKLVSRALTDASLPADAAQSVPLLDREAVTALCKLDEYIDVMIPRGGEGLIKSVTAAATMPVLKHDKGVCHMFVDESAKPEQSAEIAFNAKVQRPSACNALECLLVHQAEAESFLPLLAEKLGRAEVEFRACPASFLLLAKAEGVKCVPARESDYGQEFHDLTLAVKIVSGLDEALLHIAEYGSRHSEVICTENHSRAMRFLREADASLVAVNASSRFNDGGQLGLGAEIGISTCKLHAYGPMGLRELTTTRYVLFGNGQVRK